MSEPIQSIAQNNYILHNIDAKKLYVQEPLFTANSGDAVYVGWRPDETVLWSGTYGSTALSLSESPLNFNTIKVYYGGHNNNASGQNSYYGCAEYEPVINGTTAQYIPIISTFIGNLGTNTMYEVYTMWSGVNTTEWERIYYAWKNITGTSWNTGSNWQSVYKVIGVNRKENA